MKNPDPNRPAPFESARPDVNLPQMENDILDFWDREKIFDQALAIEGKAGQTKTYSFYDGPPFATGLPHYGHILAGVLKDIVPRYWTMKGYRVPRRFGWDCHGLPVEFEINKAHKIESRKQVLEMGVDKYNALCRSIVQRYSEDWKRTVRRTGRWVDMNNAYFTMNVQFMQSVWWVFQQMWNKGLIYDGYKVVPYSTGLSSPLSNFEANLNYKNVQDPALTVAFALTTAPNTFVLAWTTTPWTLPSNLGLAVHRETDYDRVRERATGKIFILASARREGVTPTTGPDAKFELIETVKGAALLGLTYAPLMPYFADRAKQGAFKVIHSDHVTTDSGTGVVHMAPAFGEDDYLACRRENMPIVNPIDDDGMFTAEVPDLKGIRVKDADKLIIQRLKDAGSLFKQETIMHSYPFCWRSDTPLIYRAVSSWFVAVEKIKSELVAANQTTHWVPENLRDGRFGNWLENARDWAISRNRFWGTPIPVWKNEEGETICIGSRAELEKLSGQKVDDLHMEFVDKITIPSPTGKSPLKRITPVLDCWFESGSMPYAQWGYPFENKAAFETTFPADFIAEGLDQTRGWFYTLMVIGTALYGKAPFKNVVVNGLVLAEDGKKMSKSLRNYPDPNEVLEKHGADALRLYMIDSPVVKAQELKFSEVGVRDVVRRILLRWWNSYSFFVNYANVDGFVPRGDAKHSPNLLDQWVLSRLHGLIETTQNEMSHYRLYAVVPELLSFIDDLTNTYIRFNRSHFWEEGALDQNENKRFAYETLHEVLLTLSKLMAPFAPFLSEVTYQNLVRPLKPAARRSSVHLESFPEANIELKHPELEEAVRAMEVLVTLGRNFREKIQVKAKIPLKSMKIIHRDARVLKTIQQFEPYFRDELNVRVIHYVTAEDQYVQITAKANFPALGKRLGTKMKAVGAKIQALPLSDLIILEKGGTLNIEIPETGGSTTTEQINASEVEIRRSARPEYPNVQAHQRISMEMDPSVEPDQVREGLAREVVRKVQAARKAADFKLDDRIRLELHCTGELLDAVKTHQKMISDETLTREFAIKETPSGQHTETAEVDGAAVHIGVSALPRAPHESR